MSKIRLVLRSEVGLKLQAGKQVVLAEDRKKPQRLGDRQTLPLGTPLTPNPWILCSQVEYSMALLSQVSPDSGCEEEPVSLFSTLLE